VASCAVLASGTGTNFEAIAARIADSNHSVAALLSDRRNAPVLKKAQALMIPAYFIPYDRNRRTTFEQAASIILRGLRVDLIVLAGFMRILTSQMIEAFDGKIINIHPSLLPDFPGTHAIERSYASDHEELGVTVHFVDNGLDSGPVIARQSFRRSMEASLEEIEIEVHAIEHSLYPKVVIELLDRIEQEKLIGMAAGE